MTSYIREVAPRQLIQEAMDELAPMMPATVNDCYPEAGPGEHSTLDSLWITALQGTELLYDDEEDVVRAAAQNVASALFVLNFGRDALIQTLRPVNEVTVHNPFIVG